MVEVDQKMQRLQHWLGQKGLDGVVITQVRNFSWITGGLADNHIVITSEVGAASLVIMRDGRRYLVASNSEVPRLMDEGLGQLGYQPREFKWHQGDTGKAAYLREIGGKLGSDLPFGDLVNVDLTEVRAPLTPNEVTKYRWLGRETAAAVEETCRWIRPGMSEGEIEAETSHRLMKRGIRPTVLLIGADERILKYRHVPPADARVQRYAMVNVCTRRWGLVIACTRFVHFGPVPGELRYRLQAAAQVNARLQAASRPGARAADLYEQVKSFYAEAGFPGEWENHHQGGAIGYGERDWVISPGVDQVLQDVQAYAWNPTVQGAKVEDTVLVDHGKLENLTLRPQSGWPTLSVRVDGRSYASPDILVLER